MSRYVTEFVGTFFLVLTIGLTAMNGTPMAPLAIGSVLMAMVYMGGHISGAHYNPAVSVAILIRGKMEARDLIPYVLAQLSGAIVASLTVMLIVGDTFAPAPAPEAGLVVVLLCEALFTFALSLVILNVATDDATAGNSYYGLAIGFTVMGGSIALVAFLLLMFSKFFPLIPLWEEKEGQVLSDSVRVGKLDVPGIVKEY